MIETKSKIVKIKNAFGLEVEMLRLTDEVYAIKKERVTQIIFVNENSLSKFLTSDLAVSLIQDSDYHEILSSIPEDFVSVNVAVRFWLQQASLGNVFAENLICAWIASDLKSKASHVFGNG